MLELHKHARDSSLHVRMLANCRCVGVGDLLMWEHCAWPPVPNWEPEEALPHAPSHAACQCPRTQVGGFVKPAMHAGG